MASFDCKFDCRDVIKSGDRSLGREGRSSPPAGPIKRLGMSISDFQSAQLHNLDFAAIPFPTTDMSSTDQTTPNGITTNQSDSLDVPREVSAKSDWGKLKCYVTLTTPSTDFAKEQTETHVWEWRARVKFPDDFGNMCWQLRQAYINEETSKAPREMGDSWEPVTDCQGNLVELYGKKKPMAETEIWPWNAAEMDSHFLFVAQL